MGVGVLNVRDIMSWLAPSTALASQASAPSGIDVISRDSWSLIYLVFFILQDRLLR
jgi:hypothetical protein